MLLCKGTFLGVSERSGEKNGKAWQMRTARVFGGKVIHEVVLSRDFDESALPAEDDDVTIEVSVNGYVNGSGTPRAGLTGWRVHDDAAVPEGRRVAAVS